MELFTSIRTKASTLDWNAMFAGSISDIAATSILNLLYGFFAGIFIAVGLISASSQHRPVHQLTQDQLTALLHAGPMYPIVYCAGIALSIVGGAVAAYMARSNPYKTALYSSLLTVTLSLITTAGTIAKIPAAASSTFSQPLLTIAAYVITPLLYVGGAVIWVQYQSLRAR